MVKSYQKDPVDGSKSSEILATEALAQVKMLSKRVDMLMGVLGWDPGDVPTETPAVVALLQNAARLAGAKELPKADQVLAFASVILHLTPEHLSLFSELSRDPQPWATLDLALQRILDLLDDVPPADAWGPQAVVQSARRNLRSAVYHCLAEFHGQAQTLQLVPPPPFDDFHGGVLQVLLTKRAHKAG